MTTINHTSLITILMQPSCKLKQLGVLLQSEIIELCAPNKITCQVQTDIGNQTDHLIIRLSINGFELFDNDIINIHIKENKIMLTCTVYSNYGIDHLIKYQSNLANFDLDIFDRIFPQLVLCMQTHIKLFS